MKSGSYSVFDHTADVGLEITAPTLEGLYETAAHGLFDLLIDPVLVRPVESRRIDVTGADPEELLVRWLSELLFLHDAEGLLFATFEVHELSPSRLLGTAAGEIFDPARHRIRTEIKAVTYHDVRIWREATEWKARVVLDV